MKRIIYTTPEGTVSIVHAAPKDRLELVLGPLTDDEYREHVYARSIPAEATNVREIDDEDIPADREFRNAWCDVTVESRIDIDCTKAKELKLSNLRVARNELLAATDVELTRALENGDETKLSEVKAKRQVLREATEPLKSLDTDGKVNCEETLQAIRDLSVI